MAKKVVSREAAGGGSLGGLSDPTVRALAERLGMVWGRGAAARGEGVHSLGCRLALCHRTSRSRIPPHCLALTLPLSPPCCTAWGWSLAFSGPHLHDCKVRGMHTLGAPPAEESRDCIRLRFTLGLDIQGRPPPPASSPLSLTQPPPCSQTGKSVSSAASSRHQPPVSPPPSAGNARLLRACSHPGRPLTPLLSLSSGLSPAPLSFPPAPQMQTKRGAPPLGSQSTLFHCPHNLIRCSRLLSGAHLVLGSSSFVSFRNSLSADYLGFNCKLVNNINK